MSFPKKIFIFWLPALVWMSLIFSLSSFHKLQASEVGWQDFVVRKTAHFLEYAILFVLYNRGVRNTTSLSERKRLFLSFVLAILFAVGDELHQTKVNGRTGQSFDVGVDSLGAFLGLLFSWKIIYFLPKKIQEQV